MTASSADEKIARLLDQPNGMALYGCYWRVLEIIAAQIEPGSQNCSVTYSVTRWSLLMSVRGSHVRHYLGQLSKNDLVTAEWNDNDIKVTSCNLLKYRDEYTRRSGASPDKLPARTELDTELDKKKINTTPKTAFVLPDSIPLVEWNAWLEVRKKKRASPTIHAMNLAVGKLIELQARGFTPKEVLNEAILRNWTGIFEPNKHSNGGSNGHSQEGKYARLEREALEIVAREEAQFSRGGSAS